MMLRLAALLFAAPLAAQNLSGPGISIELARYRTRTVHDVRYDLALDVSAPDSAVGRVTLRWTRSDSNDVVLDFRGRSLTSSTVNGVPGLHPVFNNAHIILQAKNLNLGANEATFTFVSDIAPSGASIIKSHDPDGSDYLYTLLVPADANQLFPCFDQPDLKARVTFSLAAPIAWKALANGARVERRHGRAGGDAPLQRNEAAQHVSHRLRGRAVDDEDSTVDGRTINVYVRKSRAGKPTSTRCSR